MSNLRFVQVDPLWMQLDWIQSGFYWPSGLSNPWAYDGELAGGTLRSTFEDGSLQTRQQFTRLRRTWTIGWDRMPTAELDILEAFFGTVHAGASTFEWTHPVRGTTHSVRFAADKIGHKFVDPGYWQVSVDLAEE